MELKDFILYMPRWTYATAVKHIRTKVPKETKEYIQKNNLYHITKDADTANKIIDSGYLKPASGFMKYMDSYGSPVACMFAGMPTSDEYIKNLTDTDISKNPYVNPTMISHAIEIDINKEELDKFKSRLADNVIVYKGKCQLPEDRIKKVQLVPDIQINEATGEKEIKFRKRTDKEITESPNTYIPSQEYLEYVLSKSTEFGYTNSKTNNLINTILHEQKIESKITSENIKYNLIDKIKGRIKNIFQKKLPKINQENTKNINDSNSYKKFRDLNKYEKEIKPINNIKKDNNKEYDIER